MKMPRVASPSRLSDNLKDLMQMPRLQAGWSVALWITVAKLLVAVRGQRPTDQEIAQEACFNTKCHTGDLCYIPHPLECNKFIMCQTNDVGDLYSQVMPCAFGTFWNTGVEDACERSHKVNCPNDPCRKPGVKSYGHDDDNCRTYWRCADGLSSVAKCCKPYHSYDHGLNKCVRNATCADHCPILDEELCAGRGIKSLKFPDDNCKTYWNCTGSPHPVCCQDGMGYDIYSERCVANSSCVDPCPPNYQDICAKRGVKSYNIPDKNCRTYMKCNEKGLDDPYCCRPGQRYDNVSNKCVPARTQKCKMQSCPSGFFEECHLLPVAGDVSLYKNTLANDLIMPCAVGTIFDNCVCDRDPNYAVDSLVCTLAIHAKPPDLKNYGTATAALLMIGEYGQGEKGRGKMPAMWDGGTGINIPYFGTQAPIKFFLQITFKPSQAGRSTQVLVSSCEYLANNDPTLEITLKQLSNQDGNMTVTLASNLAVKPDAFFRHEMPYIVDEPYTYSLIYDNKKVASILEPHNTALSPDTAYGPFTGPLVIGKSGLRFAHCRYEAGVDSFVGQVAEIQVAKCLTQALRDRLYPITVP